MLCVWNRPVAKRKEGGVAQRCGKSRLARMDHPGLLVLRRKPQLSGADRGSVPRFNPLAFPGVAKPPPPCQSCKCPNETERDQPMLCCLAPFRHPEGRGRRNQTKVRPRPAAAAPPGSQGGQPGPPEGTCGIVRSGHYGF